MAYMPTLWWATTFWNTDGRSCEAMPEAVAPRLARLMPTLTVDLPVFSRISPAYTPPSLTLAVS
ncbi:hypothetical protein D3C81_2332170 [compost metagenome]